MKPVSPAAAYVALIPHLTEAAREVGYALAVHGSMGRDLDVVAIPWTEEAVSAEALVMRLLSAVGYMHGNLRHRSTPKEGETLDSTQSNGDTPGLKPHGRLSWSILFDNSSMYLDISVMPRIVKSPT